MTALATILPQPPNMIYRLDAIATAVLALSLAGLAGPVTALSGWSLPVAFLFWLGVALVPWSAFNFWSSRRRTLPPWAFAVHMGVETGWIFGSATLLVLEFARLTPLGLTLLVVQGLAVVCVFLLKLRAHRLG